MSDLFSAFETVTLKRPQGAAGLSKREVVANKFADQAREQLSILEADLAGQPYTAKRVVFSGEGDKRVRQEVDKRIRRWFFQDGGFFYCELRYGSSTIQLPGGATALRAGTKLEDVSKVLNAAIQAAKSGDKQLMDELMRVSALRGRKTAREGSTEGEEAPPVASAKPRTARSK